MDSQVHVADDVPSISILFIFSQKGMSRRTEKLGSWELLVSCLWWWCRLNVIWVHKVLTKATLGKLCHSQMIHVWYIYLQNWVIYGVNVGKYISTMDHLGFVNAAGKIYNDH